MSRTTDRNVFKQTFSYLGPIGHKMVMDAFDLNYEGFEGVQRKSGEPFYRHGVEAAYRIHQRGARAAYIIAAAVLHDYVEDTDATIEDVDAWFRVRYRSDLVDKLVATIDAMTRREGETKAEHNVRIVEAGEAAIVVRYGDRSHNLDTIGALAPDVQEAMLQDTVQLAERMAEQRPDLAEALVQTCEQLAHN